MKKIIVLIYLIVKCNVLFSQEPFVVFFADAITDSIPVYRNNTDMECFIKIKEDSEKENWHNVEILDQSNDRYKVSITSCQEDGSKSVNGWVDKAQCGVWLRGKYIERELFVISLYTDSNLLTPFMKLHSKYFGDFEKYTNGKAAPILDYKYYNGEYWIKTVITRKGKKITGWTRDYCPNVYDSCN